MTLLLAAVGATVAALLELTVGRIPPVGGAQPHLVLVLGRRRHDRGRSRRRISSGPSSAGSHSMYWHNDHSDRRVRAPALRRRRGRPRPRSSRRLRPLAPIIAVFVLSIVYSMILFVALRRPARAAPGRSIRCASSCRGAIYDAVLADVGPLASRSTTVASRPSGSTGEHLPRRPSSSPVARPRRASSCSGSSSCLGVGALDGAPVLPPDHQRRPVHRPRRPHNRTVLESIPSPRGLIYDRDGGRSSPTSRPSRSRSGRPTSAPSRPRSSTPGGADRDGPGRHQHRDRQQSRARVRPRPDRRGHRPERRPGSSPSDDAAARRRGRRRGAPRVHRRAAHVADPRLHGPGLGGAAARPRDAGYLPDDLIGKAGVEATYETRAARRVRHRERRAQRAAARRPRSSRPIREAQPATR